MRTYTEADEARYNEVLKNIQRSVPESLRNMVVTKEKLTPNVEMVMRKALEADFISDEKKASIQALLDAGDYSRSKFGQNQKIAKLIDKHVSREINKAIKAGLLPPKSHIKYLPSVIKANENN